MRNLTLITSFFLIVSCESAIQEDFKAIYQKEICDKYRQELVETAVEQDEKLMEAYLGGEEIKQEDLIKCVRKGCLNFEFVPVLTGSAFKNKGVQPLLDAVVDY